MVALRPLIGHLVSCPVTSHPEPFVASRLTLKLICLNKFLPGEIQSTRLAPHLLTVGRFELAPGKRGPRKQHAPIPCKFQGLARSPNPAVREPHSYVMLPQFAYIIHTKTEKKGLNERPLCLPPSSRRPTPTWPDEQIYLTLLRLLQPA